MIVICMFITILRSRIVSSMDRVRPAYSNKPYSSLYSFIPDDGKWSFYFLFYFLPIISANWGQVYGDVINQSSIHTSSAYTMILPCVLYTGKSVHYTRQYSYAVFVDVHDYKPSIHNTAASRSPRRHYNRYTRSTVSIFPRRPPPLLCFTFPVRTWAPVIIIAHASRR